MSLGRRVLVPVANPATVAPLLHLAARIAEADDGCVVPVTVIAPGAPEHVVAEAHEAIAEAERVVATQGRHADGQVLTCAHPAEGVLDAIGHAEATLVVMGWRGRSSTSDIFGRMIDTVVGRSSVPLAIVRLGDEPYRRVLFPVSSDHLLPGGVRGLELAAGLADRLRAGAPEPTTVLRTGNGDGTLPASVTGLSDRVHHDPRRIHHAVGAAARPHDLVVAAVAPTVSGLRAATTHLAWAAPEATLLVAVDVGPTEQGLIEAVDRAGRPAPPRPTALDDEVRVVVTACLPEATDARPDDLQRVLRRVGVAEHVMAWWPTVDPRPHVRATVTVRAPSPNAGLSQVMTALHEAEEFRGAEITYDLDRAPQRLTVALDDLTVSRASASRRTRRDHPRTPTPPV
jgi:hypothetical protein